jgi:lysophospholipase L1-like esterase
VTTRRPTTAALAAILLTLITLGACSSDGDDAAPASTPSAPSSPGTSSPAPGAPDSSDAPGGTAAPAVGPQYVALGDSFQAAPGVPETSGADGCFRSSHNYAQLVARRSGLTVTDKTCSGATTDGVLSTQVPAITSEAELVTIGIGGNDFDLFTSLISSCLQLAQSDPDGSPCTDASSAEADETIDKIAVNVGDVLDAIAEAAPDARVVVVGYPDLLPTSGSCPDRIPLAAGDYPFVNDVTHGLSDALRSQAERRDFDFVDLRRPSKGHDICSAEPWVNGATVADDGTIPFHPFAVEQQAVAAKIVSLL